LKTGFALTSIRFKIALAFSLVFLSVTIVTSYFIYQNIEQNLKAAHQFNLQQEANNLLDRVNINPIQIPLTTTEQYILIWEESELGMSVIFEEEDFPSEYLSLFQDYNEFESVPITPLDHISIDSLDIQMVSKKFDGLPPTQLKLLLAKDNTDFYERLRAIKTRMIWANLLSVFLSALLAYVVSGLALRPIQKIIDKTRTIQAAEQMERLIEPRVQDEVGQLSVTINEMIARIESSIKTQNQFFAMAAHELRTPLANMQSELEYHLSMAEQELRPETLTSLREEVIRLKNIVHDFLLMSQLKSETLALRKTQFRLDDLLYDTLERMRPSLTKGAFDLKLSMNAAPEKLKIFADREKLEGVLVNLLDNARKYGSNAQPIGVQITESGDTVLLTIQNALAPDPTQTQKGMGLGLQIAREIIAKHGFGFEQGEDAGVFWVGLVI
jgi:signal transduction histidine kinase